MRTKSLPLPLPLFLLAGLLLTTGCGAASSDPDPLADPTPTEAAAELVTAPVNFFATGSGPVFPGPGEHLELDPAESLLVGPHSAIAVSRVTLTTTIEAEHAAAALDGQPEHGWRAADGQEFLVVRTAEVRRSRLFDPADAGVAVSILAGDQTYQFDRAFADPQLTTAPATLAVSVPEGAKVRLVLSDAGREQSLDLRTGEPGDDRIALLYEAWNSQPAAGFMAWFELGGVSISEGPLVIEGEIAGVSLYPYLPEVGWAEAGRAWLRMRLDDETWTMRGLIQVSAVITLDAADSFTLGEPGGRTTPAESTELTVRFVIPGQPTRSVGGPVVFDVAEDFRTGTLGFAPQGIVTTSTDDEGTVRTAAASEPVPVELSQPTR